LQLKADDMPITEFIHYALGELLGIEYVVDPGARNGARRVTLSSGGFQSPKRLYGMVMEVIGKNGLFVEVADGVHYVYKSDRKQQGLGITVNIGRDIESVPRVAGQVLQVVPLKYGANVSLERTLNELLNVKVSLDTSKNALFLRGERSEVVKAIGFIEMFDAPANRGRHIGVIRLTYITSEEFAKQVTELMRAEGIPVGTGVGKSDTVAIVPLTNIGGSAVFASSEELLTRVRYWADLIDQPAAGATRQYFVFRPKFARADEIGASLAQLLGGRAAPTGTSRDQRGGSGDERTGQAPDATRPSGFATDTLRMVVVEGSNSLVFNTSGTEYQGIYPLLEQLDVLPKQVLLDIMIAEVTLKDEFKFGFEWALQNGEVSLTTLGAFGASTFGGTALSIDGSDGRLVSQLLQTSQLVKVLSNPTMMVRDGVTANINVGSDISVVGSTTFDPINGERQTTASTYRKTGVDVTVTPTINAQGVVLMEVEKTISNAVPNSTGAAGNPDIFERTINTEVVAASGQTVLLGGLISEDVSSSGSGTPGLSNAPMLGWLFKAEADSGTRTELVMLITARILNDLKQWEALEARFNDGLRYLDLSPQAEAVDAAN
jgi:general secretion pathway protein D